MTRISLQKYSVVKCRHFRFMSQQIAWLFSTSCRSRTAIHWYYPKTPAETLFDLDKNSAATLIESVQCVARGVQDAFAPDGIKLMQFNGRGGGPNSISFSHAHCSVLRETGRCADTPEVWPSPNCSRNMPKKFVPLLRNFRLWPNERGVWLMWTSRAEGPRYSSCADGH